MSDKTKIEWAEATWNPVTGCEEVSPGCDHCYAKTFAERWRGTPGHPYENGFDLTLRPERLDQPLRWKRPRRVFVNSMSDLFHDDIPDGYIAHVFAIMALAEAHTFQLLTKRHGRMRSLLRDVGFIEEIQRYAVPQARLHGINTTWAERTTDPRNWPLRNVWLGVSVENQQWADIRIPALLDTPAAVRWLSMEPLLGPVNLARYTGEVSGLPGDWSRLIDWVVAGGESGPGARPMHPDWVRYLRDRCAVAEVPFFLKQLGQYGPVRDRPNLGDLWLAKDGATADWAPSDGHIREGGGEYRRPGTRTVVMRRHGSKKAAGRVLDGRTHDEYPAVV